MKLTQSGCHPGVMDSPSGAEARAGSARLSGIAIIFVWAGAAASGNLIAAPAKFQAASLTLPVALDVWRMQFLWIGVLEAVCALMIVALLLWSRQKPSFPLLVGICLFALQKLRLMPLLDQRTLAIIAGQPVEESSLHLVYVAAEVLKIGFLFGAGLQVLRWLCRQTRVISASIAG